MDSLLKKLSAIDSQLQEMWEANAKMAFRLTQMDSRTYDRLKVQQHGLSVRFNVLSVQPEPDGLEGLPNGIERQNWRMPTRYIQNVRGMLTFDCDQEQEHNVSVWLRALENIQHEQTTPYPHMCTENSSIKRQTRN
ncbi:hypothetical protein E4U17_006553, partial [Claviceps sp. LM77 group G4]